MVSLAQLPRPFVVGVVVERDSAAAARVAAAAFRTGADAVELNLASLRDNACLDRRFFTRWRRPLYTSCRRAPFMAVYGAAFARLPALSDEARMARQLALLDPGSAGLDIEADTFASNCDEWTDDRTAIRRQRAVAAAAHRHGAAVIWSWHPPRKLTQTEALRGAWKLRDRGADFVKIVERVRTRAEALDSLAISLVLREKLGRPFVFLALGAEAVRFRPFMTAFGASYLLARPPVGANRLPAQPLVASARALIDLR
ncbi:MAG: type I 3-dehydroquinate dehydratase [Lacunisphaera sp.]|nr:type I 3-dehydroquinate dehydratase [Lacunisphaera sp.]